MSYETVCFLGTVISRDRLGSRSTLSCIMKRKVLSQMIPRNDSILKNKPFYNS